jgi:RNA polymerase sigma-70 factor, ECF subfamily
MRRRKFLLNLVSLEDIDALPDMDAENAMDRQSRLDQIYWLVQQLRPMDRQIILCYLEDMDAASIAEITGLSPQNISTRIHRIKNLLATRYQKGGSDDRRPQSHQ